MAPRKSTLTEDFYEETVTLRGTKYTFREISADKYEELLKTAEGEDGTADLSLVLRLMIPESLIEPKLTTEQIYKKPLPVVTAIQNTVNRLHFTTEPTEPTKDGKDGTDGEEGTESPNESEAETSSP